MCVSLSVLIYKLFQENWEPVYGESRGQKRREKGKGRGDNRSGEENLRELDDQDRGRTERKSKEKDI